MGEGCDAVDGIVSVDGRKGSLKANSFADGKMEESNDRVINQLIVNNVLEEGPCQLQMGLTELKPGSVWNTMPAPPLLRTASSVRWRGRSPSEANGGEETNGAGT